jgi:hypothetical protein
VTWVKIERTPRPYLTRCRECGWQFRVDQEPYEYSTSIFDRTNPPRPSNHCRNVDCRLGPAARELRRQIQENPCRLCRGEGLVVIDGADFYCAMEDCESSRLLRREHEAFDRFIPASPGCPA